MTANLAKSAQDYFERALHDYVLARYRSCLGNTSENQGDFLEPYMLRWENWRANQLGLPDEVYAAHLFYVEKFTDQDIGSDRVYRVPVVGQDVYAIWVSTDGDDHWLELYDAGGTFLAAARTHLEVMAWGDRAWLRAQVAQTATLPPELDGAYQRTLWGKPLAEIESPSPPEPLQESAMTQALEIVDGLPRDARDLVNKAAKQLGKLQDQTNKKIAAIQEKTDEEIGKVKEEGEAEVLAEAQKAIAALEPLLSSYCKAEKLDEALAIREQIKKLQRSEPAGSAEPDPGDLSSYGGQVGKSFRFEVKGTTRGAIWGTDAYTTDSALACAAVHAGKVKAGETKVVKVTIVPPPPDFVGSKRHGVTSNDFDSYPSAYKFD